MTLYSLALSFNFSVAIDYSFVGICNNGYSVRFLLVDYLF